MTSLTLTRRVRARPAIVFDALITREGIVQWWGPDAGPVLVAEVDGRRGGRFRIRFRIADGSEHECHGEFLEVSPPERVRMTWRWTGGVEDPGESILAITLRPIGEGTEVILTHSLLVDEASRESHEAGWSGALDKLVAMFA
jgi:uncharacterized protein YndB with AHSA1/START domain